MIHSAVRAPASFPYVFKTKILYLNINNFFFNIVLKIKFAKNCNIKITCSSSNLTYGFVKNKIAGGNPPNFKSVYIKIDIWDFLFKSKVGFNFLWFSFQAFPYAEVFINAIIVRFYNF